MSLKEYWYIIADSAELKRNPIRKSIMDETIVLFRDSQGVAKALEDRCPHRNAALSKGKICGDRIQCMYHGWTFNGTGQCQSIPSDTEGEIASSIKMPSYPVEEHDGFIWVYPGQNPTSNPFRFAKYAEKGWCSFKLKNTFTSLVENCLENFLDCPHTVFVHKGWFRTQDSRSLKATVQRFETYAEAKFKDEPISTSVVSKLLFPNGEPLQHTDRFIMPSISRVDYKFNDNRHFIISSQCTPTEGNKTLVNTVVTFRFGSISRLIRLYFEPLCRKIIKQDVDILAHQTEQIEHFKGEKFTFIKNDLLAKHIREMRADSEQEKTIKEEAPVHVELRF